MSSTIDNLKKIKSTISTNIKLVVVSKTRTIEDILEIYNNGHKIFGENKVQEIAAKYPLLPKNIEWHFIGHLQTNKVKYIASYINMIHSIDSLRLLQQINKQAIKNNRIIDCLFEILISNDITKYGLHYEDVVAVIENPSFKELHNIRIKGVMGMASLTDDKQLIRQEFKHLKHYFDSLKNKYFADDTEFSEISMGMSNDYLIAIEEGATIIRIGTAIFGNS